MPGEGAVIASMAAGIQVAQGLLQHVRSSEYHDTEVELTRKQHAEDLRMAKKIHEDDIRVSHRLHHMELGKMMLQQKKEHLMSTYSGLEAHFVQLDADLVNALKESERDMYDQRNQQLNTLILSSTVMLAALTTLLIEGGLPSESTDFYLMAFSLTCGMSFALQTLCVVLCIETLRLASSFMIRRSEKLNEDLKRGREDTKRTFDNLRELGSVPNTRSDERDVYSLDINEGGAQLKSPRSMFGGEEYAGSSGAGPPGINWVVNDSQSVADQEHSPRIDDLWKNIEKKHYGIMKKRCVCCLLSAVCFRFRFRFL